jgi:hypothetical protein
MGGLVMWDVILGVIERFNDVWVMFEYVVYVVVGLVILWVLVRLVKEKRVKTRYVSLVGYLVGKGAKKVVLVVPMWVGSVLVRLYDRDGVFIEELVVRGEVQWFVGAIALALRRAGFEVEVERV